MPTRDEAPEKPQQTSRVAQGSKSSTPKPTPTNSSVNDALSTVSYEISLTKKTGDYEFIKVTAGATVPVDASPELLKKIAKEMVVVKDIIVERLEEDLKSIHI